MAICTGIIVNGIKYDPKKLPQNIKDEVFNLLVSVVEKQKGIKLTHAG